MCANEFWPVFYCLVMTCFPQDHRNLSQLPNFAFSTPLAMFHIGSDEGEVERGKCREADKRLQDALLVFPCVSICVVYPALLL